MNLCVALVVCLASAVGAGDVAPFSSTPAELLTLGRTAVAGAPTDRGLSFAVDTVDLDVTTSTTKNTWHAIYRIDDDAALEEWGQLGVDWAPWSEQRPAVRARVVTPAGREYTLDPSTLIDGQVGSAGGGVFSDRHRLQGPLPGVALGAVVELEVVRTDIAERAMPFVFERIVLGGWYPTAYARVTVVGPRAGQLHTVTHGVVDGIKRRAVDDGPRRTTEYVLTSWPGAARAWEPGQPDDIEDSALVSVSTSSWSAIAAAYAAIVDRQLRGFDAAAQLTAWNIDLKAPATKRQQHIVDAVGKNIRYTGLHVGDAAITPATPAEVLARGFGDCKDLATLMTALLRAAGLSADVALVRSSDGAVRNDVPGSALFDHAIVAVRDGKTTTWIDATDPHAIVTLTPVALQGKPALVASRSTTGLTLLPASAAATNTYREERTVQLADEGAAHIVEETTATGAIGEWLSARVHGRAAEREKELSDYGKETWSAAHVVVDELALSADGPYRSTLTMTRAQRGFTNHSVAAVYVDGYPLVSWLPSVLTRTPADDDDEKVEAADRDSDEPASAKPRTRPLQLATAQRTHVRYRIVPPVGYELAKLPTSSQHSWGPATYSEHWARDGAAVVVDYDFLLDKRTLSAPEVEQLRAAIAAWMKTTSTLVEFPHRASALMDAGDAAGAIAAHRALLRAHPSALEHERLAMRLLALQLGDAAQREARAAVALEPNRAVAHATLAHALMHDALGRWRGSTARVDEAMAAARRALQLEPRNAHALRLLADALAFDAGGRTSTNLDAVREAIALLEALPADDRSESVRANLLMMKLLAGTSTTRDFAHLKHGAAVAALWPVVTTAPLPELLSLFESQTQPSTRAAIRGELVALLFATRHYQRSQALTAYTAQRSTSDAIIQRARPCETVTLDTTTPEGFVRQLVRDAMLNAPVSTLHTRFVEFDALSSLQALTSEREQAFATMPRGVSQAFICDVTVDGYEVLVEGSAEDGYFLTIKTREVASPPTSVFLERDGATFKVVSYGVQGGALADALRRRVTTSPASALRWLRWLDALAPPTTFADPLDGDAVRLLIHGAPGDDDVRLAVAMLGLQVPALRHDALRVVHRQLADRGRSLPAQTRAVVQREMALALASEGRCQDVDAVVRELAARAPQSKFLEFTVLQCAIVAGDHPRVERLATARHARLPDDRLAAAAAPAAMLKQGRSAEAIAYQRTQTERNPTSGGAWNSLAWFELVVGGVDPAQVLKHAEQAMALTPQAGIKHTLALAQANAGDGVKALKTLTELQEAHDGLPGQHQWVVIGRAAEALGMTRYALTAYIRAAGDRPGEPDDSSAIAARDRQRLLAAGVTPLPDRP